MTLPAEAEHLPRRAFFFPHALQPGRGAGTPPGRVPFDVDATLVSLTEVKTDHAIVFADGYGQNVVGSNQDPCVLSAPFGPLHSFCRINKRARNHYVRESSGRHDRLLSHCVATGDVIIYGKYDPKGGRGPTTQVWVDTVLVVDEVLPWATTRRTSRSPCNNRGHCRARRYLIGDPTTVAGRGLENSDAYRYNLSDATSAGIHCCTNLEHYRVIVGRTQPTSSALADLSTSFVPRATRIAPATVTALDVGKMVWDDLQGMIDGLIRPVPNGPKGGWIVEFPRFATAKALCEAIIQKSGGLVAVPPLRPRGQVRRWDPATGRMES
ncbi:hypothetical protein WMF28_27975 [Sorangium sp. So ce590]|uniref:hypothetical protein n=1 Tax=Sorangium sp. So ce590 TaxID=3133317 RepID=UPI003F630057